MSIAKTWIAIDMLSIIWKSNLFDKIKKNDFFLFLQTVAAFILYECNTWTLIT